MMLSTSFATLLSLVTLVPHLASAAPTHRRQEDPQVSLTLDPDVIQPGLAFDGQGDNPAEGQVPSLTSVNNFINFCLTQADVPLTNGEQIDGGSCNPAPIGRIAAFDRLPASKFTNPPNFSDNLVEGEPFVVEMRINNLATGQFTNPNTNYYSAPQQVDGNGVILGHSHVTIQEIGDLAATAPADPTIFAFFKGFNDAAVDGVLTADVTEGLPAGVYRMCSINTGANHAPVIVSNAQHGSLDDCTYFTVRAAGEEQAEVIEEVPVEEIVEEEAEVIVEEPPVAEEIEVPPEVIEEAPVLEEEEIAQDPAAVAAVEAQSLNASYTSIQAGDACQAGDQVCTANGQFAQCVGGQLVALACPGGTTCLASPRNVGSTQIDVTCTTENVVADIIAAAGVTGGIRG